MSKIQQHRPSMVNPFIAGGICITPKKGAAKKKKIYGKAVRYRHGNSAPSRCVTIRNIA